MDLLQLVFNIIFDSLRVNFVGYPKFPGKTPKEIAKNILKNNQREKILWAGAGHFHFMWVMDFAIAFGGAKTVLTKDELSRDISHLISASYKLGRVPVIFSASSAFDAPTPRGDGLPALLYSIYEYIKWSKNENLFKDNKEKLQFLLTNYERKSFAADGLISCRITRDWVDTIDRPSSTLNNLWALETAIIADKLGFETTLSADFLKRKILKERYRDGFLTDHAKTDKPSVDAALLAVYLNLFDKKIQKALFEKLNDLVLSGSYPIRASFFLHEEKFIPLLTRLTAARYHETVIWPHLGFMYLNGLKKLEQDYSSLLHKMEKLVMKYHNFPETLAPTGKDIYRNIISCESGFTMAAGQYLDLISSE